MLRAERAYDSFNGQIGGVHEQIMDIERKMIAQVMQRDGLFEKQEEKFEKINKYLKITLPINTMI